MTAQAVAALLAFSLLGCQQAPLPDSSQTPPASVSEGEARPNRPRMPDPDTDKDGKLSEAEKNAAFDAMIAKSERFRNRADKDGDGKISPEERKAGLDRMERRWKRRRERRQHSGTPGPASSPSATDSETQPSP